MEVIGTINAVLSRKGNQLWIISPDATVYEAIQLMAERNVGALLVMRDQKLLGLVTERDYTRKVALRGKSSKQTPVSEILSSTVISVEPETPVEDSMRLMTDHRVRHLPVLNQGEVVGIVSIGDLVNWIISAQSVAIDQLQSYISGNYHA